jgi:heat-inducible transcriptional repressor
MELDRRKRQVLYAIVHDYIETAEPVGSRTISRRYDLGVSPATIRNEMSDLEDMGYLEQPHTSAGRIPSDRGYRFYVDSLLEPTEISSEELRMIKQILTARMRSAEEIVQQLARLLSALTNYTAVVLGPMESRVRLRQIQLVPIRGTRILLVGVTDGGFLLQRLIDIGTHIEEGDLAALQAWLNRRLAGQPLEKIRLTDLGEIHNELCDGIDLIETVIDELVAGVRDHQTGKVYLGGTTNILNQPEFRDFAKVKSILGLLEQDDLLWNLVMQTAQQGVSVTIGTENPLQAIQDCSLVTAQYHLGGGISGWFGLLGPTRMHYDRVFALVQQVCQTLNQLFR